MNDLARHPGGRGIEDGEIEVPMLELRVKSGLEVGARDRCVNVRLSQRLLDEPRVVRPRLDQDHVDGVTFAGQANPSSHCASSASVALAHVSVRAHFGGTGSPEMEGVPRYGFQAM